MKKSTRFEKNWDEIEKSRKKLKKSKKTNELKHIYKCKKSKKKPKNLKKIGTKQQLNKIKKTSKQKLTNKKKLSITFSSFCHWSTLTVWLLLSTNSCCYRRISGYLFFVFCCWFDRWLISLSSCANDLHSVWLHAPKTYTHINKLSSIVIIIFIIIITYYCQSLHRIRIFGVSGWICRHCVLCLCVCRSFRSVLAFWMEHKESIYVNLIRALLKCQRIQMRFSLSDFTKRSGVTHFSPFDSFSSFSVGCWILCVFQEIRVCVCVSCVFGFFFWWIQCLSSCEIQACLSSFLLVRFCVFVPS